MNTAILIMMKEKVFTHKTKRRHSNYLLQIAGVPLIA
jgi:hypothetical protein